MRWSNFAECLNYLVHPFVFKFQKFFRPKFFVIHEISVQSAWIRKTFLRVLNSLQIKEGGPNFWGEPILQEVWFIWSPLWYYNFKSFLNPNSSSFIRFQSILYDSRVLLSWFSNLYKLKRRDLIYAVKQFCRMSELFGPPFCF